MKEFFILFLVFMGYSILGYFTEIIYCSIDNKKLVVNRGFLLGPYLPIYGVGAVLIVYLLKPYQDDLLGLFVMSALICSLVEYFVSFILEKLFKIRWWDYSDKKLNINGRICLENIFLFGLGAVLIVKIIHPFYLGLLNKLPTLVLFILGSILLAIFVTDIVITIITLVRLKLHSNMFLQKDATEEVKQKIYEALSKKTFFLSRLLHAFPKLSLINDEKWKEFSDFVEHVKEEIRKKNQKKNKK